MTEKNVSHAAQAAKPNFQRHYALEIARTLEAFNTFPGFGRMKTKQSNFIAPRHDDNFNDFERHWIAPLEEIT